MIIKGSEYAKYYFIMRTLAEKIEMENGMQLDDFENEKRNKKSKKEEWGQFPLKAMISVERMLEL